MVRLSSFEHARTFDEARLRSRIASLASECGCAMGGIFLVASAAGAAAYVLATGRPGLGSGLAALGVVGASSAAGKLTGIAIARLRLLRLRRLLEARLAASR